MFGFTIQGNKSSRRSLLHQHRSPFSAAISRASSYLLRLSWDASSSGSGVRCLDDAVNGSDNASVL